MTVTNNGNGSDALDAQTTSAALIWYPLTDATSGADGTAYVPPAAAAALVSAARTTMVGTGSPIQPTTSYISQAAVVYTLVCYKKPLTTTRA